MGTPISPPKHEQDEGRCAPIPGEGVGLALKCHWRNLRPLPSTAPTPSAVEELLSLWLAPICWEVSLDILGLRVTTVEGADVAHNVILSDLADI